MASSGGVEALDRPLALEDVDTGRAPNTADVGLDHLGVLTDTGHVSTDMFVDLIAPQPHVQPVDHGQAPRVTYCTPEAAPVGHPHLTLAESLGDAFMAAAGVPFHTH